MEKIETKSLIGKQILALKLKEQAIRKQTQEMFKPQQTALTMVL
jgi:hypothetical protein